MLQEETDKYFPVAEQLAQYLMDKTLNSSPLFFRILITYFFGKLASSMRATIRTPDRGDIPINIYAFNLAASGHGKGHSMNILEENIIHKFKKKFIEETLVQVSEQNLARIAIAKALKNGCDPDEVLEQVRTEFNLLGTPVFSFDSATIPALKQLRHRLLMSGAGAINFEMDEVGSNLLGNMDLLTAFLELYDVGKIKQKLLKNTIENSRGEEIEGRTPTNMMLFGTQYKLLNGGKIEDEFLQMLDTGYARRSLFGLSTYTSKFLDASPEEIYELLTNDNTAEYVETISTQLEQLADISKFGTIITYNKDIAVKLIEYRQQCVKQANELKEHQTILKTEVQHKYFKVLKVAGAYAFIDSSSVINERYLNYAIQLVEESSNALMHIVKRKRNYVRLAEYIRDADREVTHVDLVEDLPFYKGSTAASRDLLALATAYGCRHNIVIKHSIVDGIEFLRGESMEETDLNKIIISHSSDITIDYLAEIAPFNALDTLITLPVHNYCAHHFREGYRDSHHMIPGFNLVILDVDAGVSLNTAKSLLKEYTCLFAHTKRSTPTANRFRILMPLTHIVKLTATEYSQFMTNIFNWLPFTVDTGTKDCARKWATCNSPSEYTEGALLNALLFIPQTRKEEEQTRKYSNFESLDNLERWFLLKTNKGNRSNQLIKYALILVDKGYTQENIQYAVLTLNNKFKDKLTEKEILNTIMLTVVKAIVSKTIK